MPKNLFDTKTWNIIINIHGLFRNINECIKCFEEMQLYNIVDEITIATLLHSYSHALLPEKAYNLFNSMENIFKIKTEHNSLQYIS